MWIKHWQDQYEPIPESGCWIWIGAVNPFGYGWQQRGGRKFMAHRVVYEALVGPIPHGMQLDHLCRVKCCVNPAHLEPVTGQVNTLRGMGPSALNARKTHCQQGHEFAQGKYQRICRPCHAEYMRKRRAARREA